MKWKWAWEWEGETTTVLTHHRTGYVGYGHELVLVPVPFPLVYLEFILEVENSV